MSYTDWHGFRVEREDRDEMFPWLRANVGRCALSSEDLEADWLLQYSVRPWPKHDGYVIRIKDDTKALLFKLTWGGQ